MFIPHVLSVLSSSLCLNFNQMSMFARELGISKIPGLGISKIPGSYKCYEKKKPNTNPTSQEERANLAMTPDGNVSGNSTFTSHRRTHTRVCCGHVDPPSATKQPCFVFFKNCQNQHQLKKDFELVAQQRALTVLFRSPKSWGLHCGPTQPVSCHVLLCPPRDMEPPSPPEDSSCGHDGLSWCHDAYSFFNLVFCQLSSQ